MNEKVEKTLFRELKGEQRRQLVDTQQVYETWREAAEEKKRRFSGSMRWVERSGGEYLLHKIGDVEKSLGPRSKETDTAYASFMDGRAENKEKLSALSARLDELAPVNRAMGLGRVPVVAARILRLCDEKGILGRQIFVVGTNALFAYETLAGVQFDSGLIATGDIDLLHDTRRQLSLAVAEGLKDKGLIGLLQQADKSFTASRKSYRAANKDGYLVDLIRAEPRDIMHEKQSPRLTDDPDDLAGAPITGLSWLVNAPKLEAVALDERGYPAPLTVIDPRAYALHKMWLSKRRDREKLKAARDRDQARAAARLAVGHLGLSFDSDELTALPAALLSEVPAMLGEGKKGGSSETPKW